jgi:hypothetical protein
MPRQGRTSRASSTSRSPSVGTCPRDPARAMRRVQLRGGARWPHARRTQGGRAAAGGEASGYGSPGERERAALSARSRAPYLRRWALIIALGIEVPAPARPSGLRALPAS